MEGEALPGPAGSSVLLFPSFRLLLLCSTLLFVQHSPFPIPFHSRTLHVHNAIFLNVLGWSSVNIGCLQSA